MACSKSHVLLDCIFLEESKIFHTFTFHGFSERLRMWILPAGRKLWNPLWKSEARWGLDVNASGILSSWIISNDMNIWSILAYFCCKTTCLQSLWSCFCLATTSISSFCRSSSLPGSNTKKPPRSWRVKLQATFDFTASSFHMSHGNLCPGLDVIPGTAVSPEASFQPRCCFFLMLELPVTLLCRLSKIIFARYFGLILQWSLNDGIRFYLKFKLYVNDVSMYRPWFLDMI